MDRREELRSELIKTLERMGYPQDFGRAVANQLGSEKTMSRMIGYLNHARPSSAEEIVDEMLAIMECRARTASASSPRTAHGNRPRALGQKEGSRILQHKV